MPSASSITSRKSAVNLALSGEVDKSARRYSGNLSATVDLLLVQCVQQQGLASREQVLARLRAGISADDVV
jgi:hypothetical protein